MKRHNLVTVDSSKGEEFFNTSNNFTCINCNAYFDKYDSLKIKEIDKNFIRSVQNINICNFASLCYKFGIIYSSFEAIDLFTEIIDILTLCNPNIKFTQYEILNDLETDSKPMDKLVIINENSIEISRIIKDLLKLIGFADSQIAPLCMQYRDVTKIIPKDLMEKVPMVSDLTNMTYSLIREAMID